LFNEAFNTLLEFSFHLSLSLLDFKNLTVQGRCFWWVRFRIRTSTWTLSSFSWLFIFRLRLLLFF